MNITVRLDDGRVLGRIANTDRVNNPTTHWDAFDINGDHLGTYRGRANAALAVVGRNN